jgi:hypothetical protein
MLLRRESGRVERLRSGGEEKREDGEALDEQRV